MTPSGVTLARAVAAASASPSPPAASESGSTTLRVVYWTVWYIYQIGIALLAFFTITLPRTAFAILHWTGFVSVELNFQKLCILFCLFAIVSGIVFKLKVLNKYSKLPAAEPLSKRHQQGLFDLHPDVANSDASKSSGFQGYLDEVFSAIRVFGFLEKPVFHELARHLQTRRLLAGETLNLDEDKSFYVVVDGTVQVFSRIFEAGQRPLHRESSVNPREPSISYDDEDDNGFQLLNEVESGGTLSSLFTILSLFTEGINLRYEDVGAGFSPPLAPRMHRAASLDASSPLSRADLAHMRPAVAGNAPLYPSPLHHQTGPPQPDGGSSSTDASPSVESFQGLRSDSTDDASLDPDSPHTTRAAPHGAGPADSTAAYQTPPRSRDAASPSRDRSQDASPDQHDAGEATIARASVDATLAVIPAEAFRRLTRKYPNAAAHIVQVILTRLQRVTFQTSHKYLGLTKELIRTEKALNDLACHPLPPTFYETGGMSRLRTRFAPQTSIVDEPEPLDLDYFALDPSTSGAGPDRGMANPTTPTPARPPVASLQMTSRAASGPASSAKSSAPDRFASTGVRPHSSERRTSLREVFPRSPGPQMTRQLPSLATVGSTSLQDFDLRESVMECIGKSIGLLQSPLSGAASIEASPFIVPADRGPGARPAPFRSGLGSLSFLGLNGVDDESSATMSSVVSHALAQEELENQVEILFFSRGSTLVEAGERNSGLYYVIDGFVDVYMSDDLEDVGPKPARAASGPNDVEGAVAGTRRQPSHSNAQTTAAAPAGAKAGRPRPNKALFSIKPGGIAGYLSAISGFPSYVDLEAKTDVYVGFLPARALESIMDRKPVVLLTLGKRLLSLLPPLIRHIDTSLDWMATEAGQVIYREGERSDSFYIVISGRLRSIVESKDGVVDVVAEHGQGDSIGELDCITASPRPSTLHAIRDSELVRMPMTLFNAISVRHPPITIQVSRIIASRVRAQVDSVRKTKVRGRGGATELGKNNFNLKTVALIPNTRHVPIVDFASRLKSSLEDIGAPTLYLNQATVLSVLGRHAFSRMGKLKLAGWLAETEQRYRIVLYVADTPVSSPWTQTCIRQADFVMLVSDGGADPGIGEYERLLTSMKTTARKELVLLHPDRNVPAGSTRPWLKPRPWIHAHHHVLLPGSTPLTVAHGEGPPPVVALRHLKERVQGQISKYRRSGPGSYSSTVFTDDFARLARRLCGKSIGLVLGGGGARGISHIGVLRVLQERNIPVDMIGGTSIGSFVGGLYARNADLISTLGRAKTFAARMSSMWRIATDVTYPIVAYTSGHLMNRGIYKSFYDYHIEDFWLPFWTNTTNITWSRMEVHTTGYAWRYIRASMSLAGLLPPLCDNGDMLVDGGYIDNLPVSVMLEQGADVIFAVDVGSIDDTSPRHFGETISGWWVLLNRWNPWSKASMVPSMTEIQSRLTYVSSVKTLEEAKATPGVLYMRMPTENFATMDFNRFQEILDMSHAAARKMLADWAKEGRLPSGMERSLDTGETKKRGVSVRRNSI